MASFLTLFSPLISFLIEHPEFLLAFFSIIILRHRSRPLIVNYPFLGTLPNLLFYSSRLHDWLTDLLCSSNSSIILKGPSFVHTNILLTADPENVRHVFTANFSNYPKGPDLADALDVLGEGIFVADGDAWRFQRRLAHELIGDAKFRAFAAEASKGKLEGGLIPVLGKRATTGEVFDLQDIFLRLTFDTTCMFVFGVDPGCLTAEAEGLPVVAFANAMDDAEEVMFFWHVVPLSWWRVLRWLRVGPERRMAEAAKEKFEIPASCDVWVIQLIGKKWRNWKADVKSKSYNPKLSIEEQLCNVPKRVLKDQWRNLLHYWNSEEAKLVSERNQKSRANKTLMHTTGKRSFGQIREIEKEKNIGRSPTRVEMFEKCYTKDGIPSNTEAGDALDKMKELRSQSSQIEDVGRDDIFSKVLGNEKIGRVRMFGLGVTPYDAWGEIPSRNSAYRITEGYKEAFEKMEK